MPPDKSTLELGDQPLILNEEKPAEKTPAEEKAVVEEFCVEEPEETGWRQGCGFTRYGVLAVSVLCFTAVRSNDLSFLFTVICMTASNETTAGIEPVRLSSSDRSMAFAGAGAGALLSAVPLAIGIHAFGGRIVLGCLLVASALATIAIPWAAWIGIQALLPMRLIQGFAAASVMPMIGFVSAHWAPLSEIGKFITLLSSANQISQIVTMPACAHMCVTGGWPLAYYVHGGFAILVAVIFLVVFRNSPEKHPLVGKKEVERITDGVSRRRRRDQCVPYRQIVASKEVWAIWVAFLGNSFGFQLILQFMPTYLNKVLSLPIERTGFSAAVPPLTQLIVKMAAGVAGDKIKCIDERRKLQLFNTLAMGGCGVFLLPMGYLDKGDATLGVVCFTASLSCLGLVTSGSMKAASLVARQYSHFVMSIVQLVICIGMLLIPFLVSALAPNNSISEWRVVFSVVCCILLATNAVFCLLCSAQPAEWTKQEK